MAVQNMPKRKALKTPTVSAKRTKTSSSDAESTEAHTSTEQSVPAEIRRLNDVCADADWKLWGPYLSERQWGTVREDYSEDGNCWEYFGHDAAVYRAYRWGEDGLFGWSDNKARLCHSLALWNGKDPILKERLYGLTGPQGNHGEDVKECYFYLNSSPTHSYTKALYKYPMAAFPYDKILNENTRRGVEEDEFELLDTGIFDNGQYWDVFAECAKESPTSLLFQYTIHNRSDSDAKIHVLPQVWFRNTWSWSEGTTKPEIKLIRSGVACCQHTKFSDSYEFQVDKGPGKTVAELIFTENETNLNKMDDSSLKMNTGFTKDAFHEFVIKGNRSSVNAKHCGTKVAAHYKLSVPKHKSVTMRCRIIKQSPDTLVGGFDKKFSSIFNQRITEHEMLYNKVIPSALSSEERSLACQAYAGLCFTKQFFFYHVGDWAKGRNITLNAAWKHMRNHDIISMPDKWEFPWYATWDLAFHMIPFAKIDPGFAKRQLLLLLSERYMHPNGQLPAYEFNFSDVNPPVHAWACLEVYLSQDGHKDVDFLKKAFHKLLLNFTWWVNKKDRDGRHIYHGGFLGLDNISCVHRSEPPEGTTIDQVDGTCWMAFYCVCMLRISLELSEVDTTYEDLAMKFLDHHIYITQAVNDEQSGLWDSEDKFYYDRLMDSTGDEHVLRVRSLVGLTSLFAVCHLDLSKYKHLPMFTKKIMKLQKNSSGRILKKTVNSNDEFLLTVVDEGKLKSLLRYISDESEFLSPYGIRALSKYHKEHPVKVEIDGEVHSVSYCPGESNSSMFGGNSNWRGPVWICMNYLLLESVDVYGKFFDVMSLEFPFGSSRLKKISQLTMDIRRRLTTIFLKDNSGSRPVHGNQVIYKSDPYWKDLILFYEYFHGDTGRGCGASHQTGWSALIVNILNKLAEQGN